MIGGTQMDEQDKVFLLSIDALPGRSGEELAQRLGHTRSAVADRLDCFVASGLVACLHDTIFGDSVEGRVYDDIRLTESGKRALET